MPYISAIIDCYHDIGQLSGTNIESSPQVLYSETFAAFRTHSLVVESLRSYRTCTSPPPSPPAPLPSPPCPLAGPAWPCPVAPPPRCPRPRPAWRPPRPAPPPIPCSDGWRGECYPLNAIQHMEMIYSMCTYHIIWHVQLYRIPSI